MEVVSVLRKNIWLLGLVSCLIFAPAIPAAAMNFELVPYGDPGQCGARCPLVISATGDITNETPQEFVNFLAKNVRDPRLRSIVFLHSPGGAVLGSMRLGEIFRKAGVMVVVGRVAASPAGVGPALFAPGARCFSACVYAFMGGKKRVVPPEALLGIHRMHFDRFARDAGTGDSTSSRFYGTPDFVAKLSDYAGMMGISRDLVNTAEHTSAEGLHIVTSAELRKWRLGQRKF